jgi:hypothetical protein
MVKQAQRGEGLAHGHPVCQRKRGRKASLQSLPLLFADYVTLDTKYPYLGGGMA